MLVHTDFPYAQAGSVAGKRFVLRPGTSEVPDELEAALVSLGLAKAVNPAALAERDETEPESGAPGLPEHGDD